jgi:hypothetical protein
MSDAPQGTTQNSESRAADPYAPPLPAAVRRAAARADELAQQINGDNQNVENSEGSREGGEQYEQRAGDQLELPLPETPQPYPPPQPREREEQPDDSWQHRYRTLQGKYDHEIPQMRAHIQQLENLIASMQAAPRQEIIPAPQPEIQIPEDDYTTYGPEFVDSTRRWARAELQQDFRTLQQQVEELRNHQQSFSGDRIRDRVRNELDRDPELTGRWEQLDHDPGFNTWLQDFDPFSGKRRLDMLREAYAGGDAVRTGRFFKAYIHEHTAPPREQRYLPPQTASQTPYAGNGNGYSNGAGRMDLSAYAAPGRASNATPGPGAPERRIWTNREIQAFYDGRLKGRYRGREAEADRTERDILSAAAEGRIQS